MSVLYKEGSSPKLFYGNMYQSPSRFVISEVNLSVGKTSSEAPWHRRELYCELDYQTSLEIEVISKVGPLYLTDNFETFENQDETFLLL